MHRGARRESVANRHRKESVFENYAENNMILSSRRIGLGSIVTFKVQNEQRKRRHSLNRALSRNMSQSTNLKSGQALKINNIGK